MTKSIKKVRGKSRYYIYWILAVGILFTCSYKAINYLSKMDFFLVKDIHIRGNILVNHDQLHTLTLPFQGTNIFEVDISSLIQQFQTISRIKSVKVMRILPSKLIVTVKERTGVFYLKDNSGEFHPIDRERYILDKADWYLKEDLPLISLNIPKERIVVGQKIEDLKIDYIFEVFDIMTRSNLDILDDISEFYFIQNDLYFIDMKSGSRVILSTDDIAQQINRFIFLRNNQGFNRNSTIDLRFGSQIIVTKLDYWIDAQKTELANTKVYFKEV